MHAIVIAIDITLLSQLPFLLSLLLPLPLLFLLPSLLPLLLKLPFLLVSYRDSTDGLKKNKISRKPIYLINCALFFPWARGSSFLEIGPGGAPGGVAGTFGGTICCLCYNILQTLLNLNLNLNLLTSHHTPPYITPPSIRVDIPKIP